jgi:hypothetical protein
MIAPANPIAALLTLSPILDAAFFAQAVAGGVRRLLLWAQLLIPAALSVPYALAACGAGVFRWGWFALYAVLPMAIAGLLEQARRADGGGPTQLPVPATGNPGGQRGNWRDSLFLATLGLAVDLRCF